MDNTTISNRLKALAAGVEHRSKTARLRDLFDDVEAALSAGVHSHVIVNELKTFGLDMSVATFHSTLKRLRKERGAALPKITSAVAVIDEPAKIVTAAPRDQASQNSNLETIMKSTPDLDALAKLARKKKSP
jgi:hypothetical protein